MMRRVTVSRSWTRRQPICDCWSVTEARRSSPILLWVTPLAWQISPGKRSSRLTGRRDCFRNLFKLGRSGVTLSRLPRIVVSGQWFVPIRRSRWRWANFLVSLTLAVGVIGVFMNRFDLSPSVVIEVSVFQGGFLRWAG